MDIGASSNWIQSEPSSSWGGSLEELFVDASQPCTGHPCEHAPDLRPRAGSTLTSRVHDSRVPHDLLGVSRLNPTSIGAFEAECGNDCPTAQCGDGIQQAPEECDDGNNIDGDGCNANCGEEYCGDDIVQPDLGEECDWSGSSTSTAGCMVGDYQGQQQITETCNSCQLEVEIGVCEAIEYCGDGILNGLEECDDGNNQSLDGCSAVCESEDSDPPSSGADLLAHYPFNEGSGSTTEDQAGNNDASILGAEWTDGQEGFALEFSAGQDIVQAGTLDITGQITMAAWVKP